MKTTATASEVLLMDRPVRFRIFDNRFRWSRTERENRRFLGRTIQDYLCLGSLVEGFCGEQLTWSFDADHQSDICIIAYVSGRKQPIIGSMKCFWVNRHTISSGGSYVVPEFRKKGIGSALWGRMIRRYRPKEVRISTISDRGKTLALSLKEKYPQIKFRISDDGKRTLRDLKKRHMAWREKKREVA